jgi:hypothetical protein
MPQIAIKVLTDYNIIIAVLFIAASIKWGDWKNWQQYYPTVLFFTAGNLVYVILTYNYPLWEFESPIFKCTVSNLLAGLVAYPSATMLYLSGMPTGIPKKVLWMISWVFLYSTIEIVSYWLGFFSYHNNWNICWSVLFNCSMFPLLWLHYKKPPLALLSAIIIAVFVTIYFRIPFSTLK